MKNAAGRVVGSAGVLDAGVVLTRLDRNRRSHREVVTLFERSATGSIDLSISVVNLAEALRHGASYRESTGVDLVALLSAFRIGIVSPDVDVARRVASLALLEGASLADRFAVATAEQRGARLHTTDTTLAAALRKRHLPVTLY